MTNTFKKKDEIFSETVMLRLTKKEKKNLASQARKSKKSYGRHVAEKLGL